MTDTTADVRVVLTSLPDREAALAVARTLVEEGLAACVSLLAPATSIYRWQGRIETADEVLLMIKTTTHVWPALRTRLAALHPYEIPEILALDVADGAASYLQWVASSVAGAR